MFKIRHALLALVSTGLIHSAQAAEYTQIDSDNSKISFHYSQMNVKMDGKIDAFKITDFSFDPQAPEKAKLVMEVPVSSVDAGYPEANTELQKDEWLNANAHPIASFEASELKALGENKFELRGQLSIKGKAQEITVPLTVAEQDSSAKFTGEFTFKRNDFALGEGSWSDDSIVANDIVVEFTIQARP